MEIQNKLKELVELDQEIQKLSVELDETPQSKALLTRTQRKAEIISELKTELKETKGVQATDLGHVGYEIRKTVTYSPALIREKLPELAHLLIVEEVDKDRLSKLAGAAVKCGIYPDTMLDELAAAADVVEKPYWILDLVESISEPGATVEPPRRGARSRKAKPKEDPVQTSPIAFRGAAGETVCPACVDVGMEPISSLSSTAKCSKCSSLINVDGTIAKPEMAPGITHDEPGAPSFTLSGYTPENPPPEPVHCDPDLMGRAMDPGLRMSLKADELQMVFNAIPMPPRMNEPDAVLYWRLVAELIRRDAVYTHPAEADVRAAVPYSAVLVSRTEIEIMAEIAQLPAYAVQRTPEQEEQYRALCAEMERRMPGWEDPLRPIVDEAPKKDPEPATVTGDDGLDF